MDDWDTWREKRKPVWSLDEADEEELHIEFEECVSLPYIQGAGRIQARKIVEWLSYACIEHKHVYARKRHECYKCIEQLRKEVGIKEVGIDG